MLGGYQDSADSLVRASNHGLPIVPNTQQLDTLNRAFEIASGETKVIANSALKAYRVLALRATFAAFRPCIVSNLNFGFLK